MPRPSLMITTRCGAKGRHGNMMLMRCEFCKSSDVASPVNRHYDEIVVFLTREGLGLSAGGGMGGLLTGADENGDGGPAAAGRDEGIRRTLGTARS
jgi:hypothetical protein